LTGGAGNDIFAFRTDSGVDVITDFSAGDAIHIDHNINGLSLTSPGDLSDRIANDASGNAVLDLGNGNTVTIVGLSADQIRIDIGAYIHIV
jgi:hypothetical protein